MKKLITLIGLTALVSVNTLKAQTNTNIFSGIQPIIGEGAVTTLGFLQDTQPYITNGDLLIGAGALKSGSRYGGYMDLQVPVNTNSWQVTYGTALGYVNKSFYSASLPVTLGTTVNIPFASQLIGPAYLYVDSGPGYNFRSHQFIVQSFAGFKLNYAINAKWGIGASYGYGIISDVKEQQQQFGFDITFKLH